MKLDLVNNQRLGFYCRRSLARFLGQLEISFSFSWLSDDDEKANLILHPRSHSETGKSKVFGGRGRDGSF